MATIYGYGRHSTDKQGLTEEAQRSKVEAYIQSLHPDKVYGGWLYDAATSGKTPMLERPEGRKLLTLAEPGDHVVWAKLDRAFRSLIDGASTLAMLTQKGVHVHSLDSGVDTNSPQGRVTNNVMLSVAEFERELASQRTREALGAKRRLGLPVGPGVPVGWKKVGSGKSGRFMPDQDERDQAGIIASMRHAGMSHEDIVASMRRVVRPNGRQWNRETVRRAILAAALGFPKVVTESELRELAET